MKKFNTGSEFKDLPVGTVILLGVDGTAANAAPLQRQSNGQWFGIGLPLPIDPETDLAETAFPVGVVYEGLGRPGDEKAAEPEQAPKSALDAIVFGGGK